jgi:chemotaxis signal transduction protein
VSDVHVRVGVGGEQYALPVQYVHEVIDLGELTPIPGAPDYVLGLRNMGGEILPAFDLASLLEIERGGPPGRLLIAEHDGRRGALAVNRVIDVAPLTGPMQEPQSPNLLARTVIDGTLVGVLAVDVLLDTICARAQP